MSGFSWDWAVVAQAWPALMSGLYYTVLVTLCSFALSLSLGLLWAILRLARIPVVSPLVTGLVNLLRGTPTLIQLYFVFYILPQYGLTLPIIVTGIISLGLANSGYHSEVFRTSIESIRRGQWEACYAMRLPRLYVWRGVILPQAMPTAVPMLGTYFILSFKDSAIVSAIGLSDLMFSGIDVGMQYFKFTEPLTMVALIYLTISYGGSLLIRALERRLHAGS